MQNESLTIEAAAQMLQIDSETVKGWLARGLRHVQDGDGHVSIQRRDLDAFLAQEGQGTARDAATEA